MGLIYADNAATTRMSRTAIRAMLPYLETDYGNPSSLHAVGRQAAEGLRQARRTLAACLGCRPGEIVFTGGGSEADNQAIRSAAALGARTGKRHILSTAFEHHAVLRTLEDLERQGFQVELLPVGPTGNVTAEQVEKALRPDTCLVTVMYANNEVGSVLPVGEIGRLCRSRGVLFHTDAVQAAGHLPIRVKEQCIDLLSLSGHKFCGPKGVGALYVRQGLETVSLIRGGSQEGGRRAGTENVAAIAGMAAALREACEHLEEESRRVTALRDRLIRGLSAVPHACLTGDPEHRHPGSASFCFEGVEGESLLLLLDRAGICASSGSACTAGAAEPSHVLLALGLPAEAAHGSLRLTLGAENTEEDVDTLLREVPRAVERLRALSPLWRDKAAGKREFLLK